MRRQRGGNLPAPEPVSADTLVRQTERAVLQEMRDSVGAIVMGRTSFDKNEGDGGWDGGAPLGDTPCFVVTHHAPERSHPSIYTFVTDGVATAIEQGKQTAGAEKVSLFGATVMQQALPLGLVDEIRVHVISVLLSGGTPLFAALDSTISLERRRPRPRRTWDSVWCSSRPNTSDARRRPARTEQRVPASPVPLEVGE